MRSGWRHVPSQPGKILGALLGGALLVLTLAGAASAQTSWLDAPPRAWNVAGAPIPAPPPTQLAQQICIAKERHATNAEETLVAGAGWRLEEYWTTLIRGNLAVVVATSDYDGMCRPIAFNAFAFADGKYVGTLSPENWNSRTDGVLRQVPDLPSDGVIQATFTRYAPTDPLCCASRGTTRVTYHLVNGIVAPVTIDMIPPMSSTPPKAPTTLPHAGNSSGLALVTAGLVALGLGLLARRIQST